MANLPIRLAQQTQSLSQSLNPRRLELIPNPLPSPLPLPHHKEAGAARRGAPQVRPRKEEARDFFDTVFGEYRGVDAVE